MSNLPRHWANPLRLVDCRFVTSVCVLSLHNAYASRILILLPFAFYIYSLRTLHLSIIVV